MTGTPEEFVDVLELTRRTHLGKSSWDKIRMTEDGPPYIKIGRRVIYRWSDVQSWLSAQARTSTREARS